MFNIVCKGDGFVVGNADTWHSAARLADYWTKQTHELHTVRKIEVSDEATDKVAA